MGFDEELPEGLVLCRFNLLFARLGDQCSVVSAASQKRTSSNAVLLGGSTKKRIHPSFITSFGKHLAVAGFAGDFKHAVLFEPEHASLYPKLIRPKFRRQAYVDQIKAGPEGEAFLRRAFPDA